MNKFISATQYCVSIFDGTHDTPKPVTNGYPLVTSKNILGGTLDLTNAYNISEDDYNAIQRRSAVSKWDVVFSMIGSIGETYLEKNEIIPYAIKNVGVFSCKDEHKAKWLYYYLISPYSKQFINNYLAGAVQKFLPLGTLRDFPVIPYDKSKRNILDLLSALDSKIELNNKINTELEAMAKLIYDYWFVQFDFPDENGKPYKSGGGKMVWSDELKREIPEGWGSKTLGEICEIYQPKTISEQEMSTNGRYYVFGANGVIGKYSKYNHEKSEIAVTCRGNTCGNIIRTYPFSWITGNAMVIKPKDNSLNNEFIYCLLQNIGIDRVITGSAQPQITRANLSPIKIIFPSNPCLKKFSTLFEPNVLKKLQIIEENQKLTELRDWLLPMLMNGQVKVTI